MTTTDLTLTGDTVRVLRNMHRQCQDIARTYGPNSSTARAAFESYGQVMSHVLTPGIRLWPDSGREDCLSLSGLMGGMSFGIIWRADARTCESCGAYGKAIDGRMMRVWSPTNGPLCADDAHVWDAPAGVPSAGTWTFHS